MELRNGPETAPSNLARKLAAVMALLAPIIKEGWNDYHRYSYAKEAQFMEAIRGHLATAGVMLTTSVEKQEVQPGFGKDKNEAMTLVSTLHTFVDSETGESWAIKGQGQGMDKGDKGLYKAITGATKYALWKNFLIPVNDDPENEAGATGQPKAAPKPAPAKPTPATNSAPAPRPAAPAAAPSPAPATPAAPPPATAPVVAYDGDPWEAVIHFGKNKDRMLGELDDNQLRWYQQTWQPKEFNGRFSDNDLSLRAALDATIGAVREVAEDDIPDDVAAAGMFDGDGNLATHPSAPGGPAA